MCVCDKDVSDLVMRSLTRVCDKDVSNLVMRSLTRVCVCVRVCACVFLAQA